MLEIIVYIICGFALGLLLGVLACAVLVDRATKRRQRELARLIGRRGCGKTGVMPPFCYLDQEQEEEEEEPFEMWEMQEGPDETDEYLEQCYEYELKCKEEVKQ